MSFQRHSCLTRIRFELALRIIEKASSTAVITDFSQSCARLLNQVFIVYWNQPSSWRNDPVNASINWPDVLRAVAPNQVWSWDISYLPSWVRGQHFYLYMIVDIYSRKIIAAEVFASESGKHAAELLQRAVWNEKCSSNNLVLHSDNGGPMRSDTLLAKMYALGVLSSYSRPRVSNDNPYSESLFRTLKYCPWWPENGFRTIDDARVWVNQFCKLVQLWT